MSQPFVILTGASGVGKTSIAQRIEDTHPEILVYQGDRIGLPPADVIAGYGPTDEPGGPTQRAFALYWIARLAPQLDGDKPILLETQCRIAFLHEALAENSIKDARIILVECSDAIRERRLIFDRKQPDLANENMRNWSRFLHNEAEVLGDQILDTGEVSLSASVAHVLRLLNHRTR